MLCRRMDERTTTANLERRLTESETRHRLLIESWAQAEWETDHDGVVVVDSPSWRAYTGQTLDEWLGHGWLNAIHTDDRAFAERQWEEAIAARGLVNAEFRLRAPDGGWRWTNVRAAPVLDAGGRIEKWAGINIDIDARKRTEAALRESEKKYRTLFETMSQGFAECEMVRDAEGRALDVRYIELNPSWARLTGLPVSDVRGRTAREVVPGLEDWWIEMYDRVVTSGTPERIEHEAAPLGRCFEVQVYPGSGNRFSVLYDDITERKRAEATLRMSEEKQSFLLQLSDALRPLRDPGKVRAQACRLLGEHLAASRVYYVEYQPEQGYGIVADDYLVPGLPSLAGHYPFEAFRSTYQRIGHGRTWIVPDVSVARDLPEAERDFYAAQGVVAWMNVPLAKAGVLEAALCVVQTGTRDWTTSEISLAEETAERLWAAIQRGRSEAELSESEERFRQFATAASTALWIRNAETLKMEYVSRAIEPIYGALPDTFLNGVEVWASAIVPDDRASALGHLERARQGEAVVHEFRIQRLSDGAFRWIRNTDFPLFDADGRVQRIGGIAEDMTEAKLAVEHQSVLLAELQHRVRNIMGMIRSMANRTASGALAIEDYRSLLEGRLLALARVQALLTREANAGGSLRGIIESEVAVQAHQGEQFTLSGPDIKLSPKAVEVLTLAFHELATNALKYGAFSVPDGHLTVRWTPIEKRGVPWLALDWIEEGAPPRPPSTRRGFGSELIEARIPYELGGRGKITIGPEGARCHLEFPLKDGESILETDAPQPATIFGGTLDMAGAPDLTGRMVLIVEDDYYMAHDTAKALRGAGATVLGPCPNLDATQDLLEDEVPTHAVLDLNLGGGGPNCEIARMLMARGVHFIFLTGYDPNVIPKDMEGVVRLQKPLPFRAIIEAVAQL